VVQFRIMITFEIDTQNSLPISYSFIETNFGECIVASTEKGICNILFADTQQQALLDLQSRSKNNSLFEKTEKLHLSISAYFKTGSFSSPIIFHLIGTQFQTKVWQALITIPFGTTSTYQYIAETVGNKKSSRAVGAAIGNNPIGYIIPCHRVLKSDGGLGGFRWGIVRKKVMLSFETQK
jgi:AraC family transcriptional regulator of adaptative response/methylated-DNA-[protein]-cysteine methyltransferase